MLSASYNHWKGLTGSYVWTNLTHRTVQNAFSTEVTYDSLGRSISKSINVDQQQFNNFNLGGKIPIGNTPLGVRGCLLYTSPSPRDPKISRMPSSA